MKKKFLSILFVLAAVFLAGCGCEHDYAPATCVQPATCRKCGKHKGKKGDHIFTLECTKPGVCIYCGAEGTDIAGHIYKKATCTTPATCIRCGETTGKPLEHEMLPANYQQGEHCRMCDYEKGSKIPGDFENRKIICNITEGVTYDYITKAHETDDTVSTKVTFQKPELIGVSADPDNGYSLPKAGAGYTWISITVRIESDDEYASKYGVDYEYLLEDYYTIKDHDMSILSTDGRLYSYSVNHKGSIYDDCKAYVKASDSWVLDEGGFTDLTFYLCVPNGYDGSVIGFINSNTEWNDNELICDVYDESTLLYRVIP